MLFFDVETNGLLDTLTTIHCIVIHDSETGETTAYNKQDTDLGLFQAYRRLEEADVIVAHNGIGFDIPAIRKLWPDWKPQGIVRDTLVMSRLIFADLKERDFNYRRKHPNFPGQLIGSHSLEAWGVRLGLHKGDYSKIMKSQGLDPWAAWSQEMEDYCVRDVEVLVKLWGRLVTKGFSERSIQLEHDVARIIRGQELQGFLFNKPAALKLEAKLRVRHAELAQELTTLFPPWEVKLPDFIPKRDNKARGYVAGVPVPRSRSVVFNPASRDHIADRLCSKYGWKPTKFTASGRPMVDDSILSALPWSESKRLTEYLMLDKRLGQLADGSQAWLKLVRADGRIHGRVNSNGAVTGRMTHSHPNVAQVPAVHSPYGADCRALFTVPADKVLVGADASGLELRMLAHYMARWDGGTYGETVVNGRKEDGTDIHTVNQHAAGLPDRDTAKTFISKG